MTDTSAETGAFEGCRDRSLYYTLSLYISAAKVSGALGRPLGPDGMSRFQPDYLGSRRLRNAVDPLFNDIADRERVGGVADFLLDTPVSPDDAVLTLQAPAGISWETEGKRFVSAPPGLGRSRTLRLRRFWFTHANGAISYHLSLRYDYEHTPGDFFFLSLLQKVAAPKEFTLPPRPADADPVRATDAKTGIPPLDELRVRTPHRGDQSFWHYVRDRFDEDAAHLFGALRRDFPAPDKAVLTAADFDTLVSQAPFLEVPGLVMPVSRLLFFFQDKTFFDRLLPQDEATREAAPRLLMVQEGCYRPFQQKIDELERRASPEAPVLTMDAAYWDWVMTRPDYQALTEEAFEAARASRPAIRDRLRRDCLDYMFLGGFNQNIIDFMNQDSSEILDSIDPIYPDTEEQERERKFARYANPRAMITYVESARSLESGNDYIGTCPYAFLIHVVSLHNEFMTREYEESGFTLMETVKAHGDRGKLKRAAQAFYDFRTGDYEAYYRDRYMNIFRYDTERDVFDEITSLRGIGRRNDYIERLISNLESQTRDREARISKNDENALGILLGALGVFGFFQLVFQWADTLAPGDNAPAAYLDARPPFLHLPAIDTGTLAGFMSVAALVLSVGFTLVLAVYLLFVIIRALRT